jgi:hypothetical protein
MFFKVKESGAGQKPLDLWEGEKNTRGMQFMLNTKDYACCHSCNFLKRQMTILKENYKLGFITYIEVYDIIIRAQNGVCK